MHDTDKYDACRYMYCHPGWIVVVGLRQSQCGVVKRRCPFTMVFIAHFLTSFGPCKVW